MDSVDALAVVNARSSSDSPESDTLSESPASSFVMSSFTVAADESSFFAIAPSVDWMDATFDPTPLVTSSRSSAVPFSCVIMPSVWEMSVLTVDANASIFGLTFVV